MENLITELQTGVHKAVKHDSATKHVSGTAYYIDDLIEPTNLAHIYVAQSTQAHATILAMDLQAVRDYQGVITVLTADSVLGINDVAPVTSGDPVFAEKTVEYYGQSLFAVVAESIDIARQAAKLANINYEPLPAILTIEAALIAQSFVHDAKTIQRGDATTAIAHSPHQRTGSLSIGGQDHFYLETNIALAIPKEDKDIHIFSSTQHPTEVQHACAKVLGLPDHAISVEVRRMGGGFGGKESQPALFAAIAALGAYHTGRACKLRLDRDDDMMMTGKRHDYLVQYHVGFDDHGMIQGIQFDIASRCGMSNDLSASINDRTMFHLDNAYYLPNVTIISHRCKTHTVSNTAFRGFGGPQGMIAMERVIDEIAYHLALDSLTIRQRNYYGYDQRNITPYGMQVSDNIMPELTQQLMQSADYDVRVQAIHHYNQQHQLTKKGIALTPVKFGISFTATHLNQAGALIHIYTDGSIHLNHGGTEMGQGLFTKVAQVVAETFQVDISRIKISATHTEKVPNTSPTAASSGSDLNGKAAQVAAQILKQRLIDFAAEQYQIAPEHIHFSVEGVIIGEQHLTFEALVKQAYLNRISLSATGFYKTPKIYYDQLNRENRPFFYFAYGAALSEVQIDTLTGEYQVERVDILHDCGDSINPAIDIGQIEGGFIQGMGWLTTEELVYDERGALKTHAPSTYKIPTCGDYPKQMNINLCHRANPEDTIFRSKAVGEPPFMLGISVFNALTNAIASIGDYRYCPDLSAPATPEQVLLACTRIKQRKAQSNR